MLGSQRGLQGPSQTRRCSAHDPPSLQTQPWPCWVLQLPSSRPCTPSPPRPALWPCPPSHSLSIRFHGLFPRLLHMLFPVTGTLSRALPPHPRFPSISCHGLCPHNAFLTPNHKSLCLPGRSDVERPKAWKLGSYGLGSNPYPTLERLCDSGQGRSLSEPVFSSVSEGESNIHPTGLLRTK